MCSGFACFRWGCAPVLMRNPQELCVRPAMHAGQLWQRLLSHVWVLQLESPVRCSYHWPHAVIKFAGVALKGTAIVNVMSFQLSSTPTATRAGSQLR